MSEAAFEPLAFAGETGEAAAFKADLADVPAPFDAGEVSEALARSSPVGASLTEAIDRKEAHADDELARVRAEAFAAGRDVGAREAADDLDAARMLLTNLRAELDEGLAGMIKPLAGDLTAMVADLVRAVVGEELSANPQSIQARVEAAMAANGIGETEHRTLILHPHDAAFFDADDKLTLTSDPEVERGGFRLLFGDGGVEDGVEARLAAALDASA
ncbi:MAG: FliH/SctL family protein [Pseudomonadota bacterium]